jgi:FMN reductase
VVSNMKAVIINGGYSLSSRIMGIEQEIKALLNREQLNYEVISVHQLNAKDLLTANFKSLEIIETVEIIQNSEIIFVLTPIFKGSYSGILKTYLDVLPQKVFENKIVVPVAIGGSIAHLLALEYSLKPLLSILGATKISNPIYVVDQQIEYVSEQQYKVADEIKTRLQQVWDQIHYRPVVAN